MANILKGEKFKALSIRSGTSQGCPLLTVLFKIVLIMVIRQGRNTKEIQIGKE